MKISCCFWMCLTCLVVCEAPLSAAMFYTATNGNNTNPGSLALPWQTIQHAAGSVLPGDTVIVQAGHYDERVATVLGGDSESNRVVFQAEGTVVMKGWLIDHPYVTVTGFEITGHSDPNRNAAHVEIDGGGNYCHFLDNIVRDGIHIVRTDMMFHDNDPAADTITSASGGFLAAGFAPGQTVVAFEGTNGISVVNSSLGQLTLVTDDTLTVDGALSEEGPVHAYITGSYVYGLALRADNCLIQGNTWTNMSYDTWFSGGATNRLVENRLVHCQGWDAIHYMGSDNVYKRNYIGDSPLVVYQNSPDCFENYPIVEYHRIQFVGNFIKGFAGALGIQKGNVIHSGELLIANNVFMDASRFSLRYPDSLVVNNTFFNVAAEPNPVTAAVSHAVTMNDAAIDSSVKNNIFVGCGAKGPEDLHGWYEFTAGVTNATHNFVAGPSPAFLSKAGFDEGNPDLNGGDPGFANLADPLGVDALPFTPDDGLELLGISKLRGAGVGGVDLGAYADPRLEIVPLTNGLVRLQWLLAASEYSLQSAPTPTGGWSDAAVSHATQFPMMYVDVLPEAGVRFYRLTD